MKTFEYRGFHKDGRACKGLIEAISAKEARERLVHDGVLAERLDQTDRKLKFPAEKRAMIYRELGALLGAGLTLVKALDNLIQSPELGDARVILAGVRDGVKEGKSLAKALTGASDSVSAFEIAIIEAAEKTATVDKLLERLSVFIEEDEKLRSRIQNALVYPSFIFGAGICVAILMLGFLLPRTKDILAGSSIELPYLTRVALGLGRFMLQWGVALLLCASVAVVLFRRRLRSDSGFRAMWNRRLFTMPVIGRGYTILVNLRFSRTLAILVHGGVSLIDGLVLAGRATGSVWVAGLAESQAESVRHGAALSEALRGIPPLSGALPAWVQTGEASGEIERLLDSAGQRYQDQWDRYISRCLSFLEPILILIVGTFVLLVTLSVLLPVLSMSKAIGR